MAEYLMDHRCDIYFKNSDGENPSSIAIKHGLNRIAEEIPKLQKNGGYKSLKKVPKKQSSISPIKVEMPLDGSKKFGIHGPEDLDEIKN